MRLMRLAGRTVRSTLFALLTVLMVAAFWQDGGQEERGEESGGLMCMLPFVVSYVDGSVSVLGVKGDLVRRCKDVEKRNMYWALGIAAFMGLGAWLAWMGKGAAALYRLSRDRGVRSTATAARQESTKS